jgi:hypothetical protein
MQRGDDTPSLRQGYISLWMVETVLVSGELSLESFTRFVMEPEPNFPTRSGLALSKLLEHPTAVVVSAPWIYHPRTKSEAMIGCGLTYSAARLRLGASLEFLGNLTEYCTQDFSPWTKYRSLFIGEIKTDKDWIEYIAFELLRIE